MPETVSEAWGPDAERYRIEAFSERLAIVNQLCHGRSLVHLQAQDRSAPLLSVLLKVDPVQSLLAFDADRNPSQNLRFEGAGGIQVYSDVDGILIQFKTTSATIVSFESGQAIQTPLPDSILRLQRREFFRIAPPLNYPIDIRVHGTNESTGTIQTARGIDISCGGIVFLVEGRMDALQISAILPRVRIVLPEIGVLETGLEVRNVYFSPTAGRRGTTRAGCRFVGLNPADGARVQRYINRLEVELRRRT